LLTVDDQVARMWIVDELPDFEQLPPADQLWLIAQAVEENGGPAEYVLAMRNMATCLEELGWWLENKQITEGSGDAPLLHSRNHTSS
jgi:hypothetical protein